MPAPKNPADAGTDTPAAPDTAEYVVAPGRTVTTDDGDKGPGDTVTLPTKEGEKLQRLGFLRADDGSILVTDQGPKTEIGAEIKEQGQ